MTNGYDVFPIYGRHSPYRSSYGKNGAPVDEGRFFHDDPSSSLHLTNTTGAVDGRHQSPWVRRITHNPRLLSSAEQGGTGGPHLE